MVDLSEGFNGPMTLTVKASGAKGTGGGGAQWVAKYPPGKGLPEWDVRVDEFPAILKMASQTEPAIGEILSEAWIEKKSNNGKTYLTIWTKEQKAEKKAFSGGGGAKPNYSLEQEARKDALLIAATFIGSALGEDGNPLQFKKEVCAQLADFFQKDIMEAGK